jgi:hypothetical protein
MRRKAKPEVTVANVERRQSIIGYIKEPLTRFDVEGGCYERYKVRGGWVEVVDRGAGLAYFNVRVRLKTGGITILNAQPMHFIEARSMAEDHVVELYAGYDKIRQSD